MEWLIRKENKAAARAVGLLQGKPAAEKLTHNLLTEKPGPFLSALERIIGSEFLLKIRYFSEALQGDRVDLSLLRLLVTYLSPLSVNLISGKLSIVLSNLTSNPSELSEACVISFIEKLGSEGIIAFTNHMAVTLNSESVSEGGQATLRILHSTR